jgi:hypothetical protein
MDKRVIYATPGGGVAVLIPVLESGLTLEQIIAKDVPQGVQHHIVDVSQIQKDRTFRGAWVLNAGKISVAVDTAKEIAHAIRREMREAEFTPLDGQIAKAIPGTDLQMIEAQRQEVRARYAAMQASIDGASNTAEIKNALGRG